MWMARGSNQFGTRGGLGSCHEPFITASEANLRPRCPTLCRSFHGPNSPAAEPEFALPAACRPAKLLFRRAQGGPDKLLQVHRQSKSQEFAHPGVEKASFEKRKEYAIVEAADRILAAKPAPARRGRPVIDKISAIKMLYRVGDPLVEDRLDNLPSELERAGQADLIRTIRCVLLGQKLRRAGGFGPESGTGTSGGGSPLPGRKRRRHHGLLRGQRSRPGAAQGRRQERRGQGPG